VAEGLSTLRKQREGKAFLASLGRGVLYSPRIRPLEGVSVPCGEMLRTPPGPEGSNGKQNFSGATGVLEPPQGADCFLARELHKNGLRWAYCWRDAWWNLGADPFQGIYLFVLL